jgi:hypothetical protein
MPAAPFLFKEGGGVRLRRADPPQRAPPRLPRGGFPPVLIVASTIRILAPRLDTELPTLNLLSAVAPLRVDILDFYKLPSFCYNTRVMLYPIAGTGCSKGLQTCYVVLGSNFSNKSVKSDDF